MVVPSTNKGLISASWMWSCKAIPMAMKFSMTCVNASMSATARPRAPCSKAALRKPKTALRMVCWESLGKSSATSFMISTKIPPKPTVKIGPNEGSFCMPKINSVPCNWRWSSTAPGTLACNSFHAACSCCALVIPKITPPISDLCATAGASILATNGKPTWLAKASASLQTLVLKPFAVGRPKSSNKAKLCRLWSAWAQLCNAVSQCAIRSPLGGVAAWVTTPWLLSWAAGGWK